jgi:hypothetical protein
MRMVVRTFQITVILVAMAFVFTGFSGCISKKQTENTESATISGNDSSAETTAQLREPYHAEFEGEIGLEISPKITAYKFPVYDKVRKIEITISSPDSIQKGILHIDVYDNKKTHILNGDAITNPRTFEITTFCSGQGNYTIEVYNGYGPTLGMQYHISVDAQYSDFDPNHHVIVAVLDTGINPYHHIFREERINSHPNEYLEGYPLNSTALNFTMSDRFAFSDDASVWNSLEREKLYYIPGTKIIGAISFGEYNDATNGNVQGTVPILDEIGHGTATAGTVCLNCPEAYIVTVEVGTGGNMSAALKWAANQSWIDIITISIGQVANIPSDIYLKAINDISGTSYPMWCEGDELAWQNGKIVIVAAGNEPTPSITDNSGPPWAISVGGWFRNAKCESLVASKTVDFVSDFVVVVPTRDSYNEYTENSGTSFSAPTAAGTISKIIYELRCALNYSNGIRDCILINSSEKKIGNRDIRAALNKTAIYYGTEDFNPFNVTTDELTYGLGFIPVNPVAPWLQMGWGYVGPEIVDDAVALLLGQKQYEPSLEKQLAEPYMSAIFELRKALWSDLPSS